MENPSPTAFRCPSCGKLTQAAAGNPGQVVCRSCGFEFRKPIRVAPRGVTARAQPGDKPVQRDVVSRRRIETREQLVAQSESPSTAEPPPEPVDPTHIKEEVLEDGTRKVMKRRRVKRRDPKRQLLVLGFTVLVIAFTVLTVREFIEAEQTPVVEDEEERKKREAVQRASLISGYIQEHIDECHETLKGFLAAADTAQRTQFVWESDRVAPRMARYYQTNPLRRPEGALSLERRGLRMVGDLPVIETLWRTEDGEPMEVSFIRADSRWVIDWEEFVRYASLPWILFVPGSEEAEGEFRLYVRERKMLSGGEDLVSFQFYPPLESPEMRQRGQSPRVLVPRDSEEGRRLLAAFGEDPEDPGNGDSFYGERDPEAMERVRVVLGWRDDGNGELFMVVRAVEADNWWGDGLGREEPATARSD